MGDTYSQSYFHLIFAVQNRMALIHKDWKQELEKYITGIIQNQGHKLIAIGSMPDHIHIFIGYNLNQKIPELVEIIKTSSNGWIKEKRFTPSKFSWQKGYGAFSYAHSQIDSVAKYVLNQKEHHMKKSFKDEYLEILKKFNVPFKEKYLFDFI
ncbi:IS200/IS605 family transposase [Marinifilum sp. D714]|uniref:IS200/IS605 family transposase n=1 Tax=Marinifilum sp. D714 TaxID=2937523 RepID=UPI0027CC05EB|nr:IS200/IS605 family transposase [Marinifilum sp. D714]MDQ2180046.1 IS200/IS605 family transposase [Marinifilum sp. D714]